MYGHNPSKTYKIKKRSNVLNGHRRKIAAFNKATNPALPVIKSLNAPIKQTKT